MTLDTFDRYKHNQFLSPITSETIEKLGNCCGLSESSTVLDATCGIGGAAAILAEKFNCVVTCIESRAEFAEEARRRAVFRDLSHLINITDSPMGELPFDDYYFDLAMMLGNTYPFNSQKIIKKLRKVVRQGGWIALSKIVWKSADPVPTNKLVREWTNEFAPLQITRLDECVSNFHDAGFRVELAELATNTAWENYYAPQARTIIDNRHNYKDSAEAQMTLDKWESDLHFYHTGGGKESLDHACFLLRCP